MKLNKAININVIGYLFQILITLGSEIFTIAIICPIDITNCTNELDNTIYVEIAIYEKSNAIIFELIASI